MKVTTERLEDCQVNVFIELDAAEADKRLRQTARQISRDFNVPGYRRGKAPLAAVIRTFGREVIQQQAIEDFGQELYEKALEEIEYEPYQIGELQDVEWDPFRMTILLPIPPAVDLGDYRSVRVPYDVEEITEERLDEYLADLQQEHAQWVPVERPAAFGDQVVLDMEGKAGDKLIMSNQDYEMLLEAEATHPLPGFHEEIVAMSPGGEKTFLLAVPEDDSDEEAAGQEATITVRLHAVKEHDMPSLDDELAMMVGDYETLEDLRASVREQLETEALQKAESQYLDKALDGFIETAVQIEYPPQAIDREAEMALSQMESNLASSGIQLDTYLSMVGKTREIYLQELGPVAEERLKRRLVLEAITQEEGLQVGPEEVEAELERMSEVMGADADEMMETLRSPGGRLMVSHDLMTTKAQRRAVEIVKGEAPPLEKETEERLEADTERDAETGGAEEIEAGVKTESDAPAETESEVEAEDLAPEAPAEQEVADEPRTGDSD